MNRTKGFIRVVLELALLGGLLIGLAAVIGGLRARPVAEQPGAPTPYLPPELRIPTPTEAGRPYPPPHPTYPPITPEPTATREPTPTVPPLPTPLPTPEVTPFPLAQPPFIPEVVGKTYRPFWIIYWQGNEVWRVDDTGQEREMLVDTFKELGQWLTDIPDPYKNSDCCLIGPRLVISPDRQKLALVVVDRIQGTKIDKFTFSVYIFDVNSRDLKFLAEGLQPVWSLDGKHIAFRNGHTLWTADLDSGQVHEITISHNSVDSFVSDYAWSPDGEYIAYTYDFSMQRLPEIWLAKTSGDSEPRELLSLDPSISIYGLTWSPDGQSILFLSPEGARDIRYHYNMDLWSVSVLTSERKQLTHDMEIRSFGAFFEKEWFFIAGFFPYERSVQNYDRDLWFLNLETNDLLRITQGQGDLAIAGFSPDGTRLVVWRPKLPPLILSLIDGSSTLLNLDMDVSYLVGGLK